MPERYMYEDEVKVGLNLLGVATNADERITSGQRLEKASKRLWLRCLSPPRTQYSSDSENA